jgi:hypothetical protein
MSSEKPATQYILKTSQKENEFLNKFSDIYHNSRSVTVSG